MLHEVITSEKVPFTYRVAGLGSRFYAWLIDVSIILLLTMFTLCLGLVWEAVRAGLGTAVIVLATFVVQWGYFLVFEWLWHGQTPGKWLVGIRVIQWNGTSITLAQSVVRNLVRVVDGLPLLIVDILPPLVYGVGFLVAACNRANRRLGDLAAGTLVVRVETQPRPIRTVFEQDTEAGRLRMTQVRQRLDQLDRRQKQTILDLCLRGDQLRIRDRARLFTRVANYFKVEHQLAPQEFESDEKFVRQLATVLTSESASPSHQPLTTQHSPLTTLPR